MKGGWDKGRERTIERVKERGDGGMEEQKGEEVYVKER